MFQSPCMHFAQQNMSQIVDPPPQDYVQQAQIIVNLSVMQASLKSFEQTYSSFLPQKKRGSASPTKSLIDASQAVIREVAKKILQQIYHSPCSVQRELGGHMQKTYDKLCSELSVPGKLRPVFNRILVVARKEVENSLHVDQVFQNYDQMCNASLFNSFPDSSSSSARSSPQCMTTYTISAAECTATGFQPIPVYPSSCSEGTNVPNLMKRSAGEAIEAANFSPKRRSTAPATQCLNQPSYQVPSANGLPSQPPLASTPILRSDQFINRYIDLNEEDDDMDRALCGQIIGQKLIGSENTANLPREITAVGAGLLSAGVQIARPVAINAQNASNFIDLTDDNPTESLTAINAKDLQKHEQQVRKPNIRLRMSSAITFQCKIIIFRFFLDLIFSCRASCAEKLQIHFAKFASRRPIAARNAAIR